MCEPTDRHRLVRLLRVVRGEMRFVKECEPRFDYGRSAHALELTEDGAVFRSNGAQLTLQVARTLEWDSSNVWVPHPEGDGPRVTGTLRPGAVGGAMLEVGAAPPPHRLERTEVLELFGDTVSFWRRWLGRSMDRGRWREQVHRSAMTLKLLTYAPSGALVAAVTAGLPQQVGGERNWDYRFTWIRDASFPVYALLGLGYVDEARAFVDWLSNRVQEQAGGASGPLKIMYRVDGSSDLDEEMFLHLEGYRGSRPVRIGNGASDQLQLDIHGEAMECIHYAARHGVDISHHGWTRLAAIQDWLADNWDRPDEGIWETHGGRQHFVYGRVNSWTAFDRALRLSVDRGCPAGTDRWTQQRDLVGSDALSDPN